MQGLLADALEAAAERQRLAATRRREGLPTKFLETIGGIPMSMVGAGAGMVDAAWERASEEQGHTPTVSTDYDPRRRAADLTAETALNTFGMPVTGAGAVPGMTLASGWKLPPKKPPVVAVTHGTGSPAEYVRPNLPPPTHDLGIHVSVNPNVSFGYSPPKAPEGTVDFMSGLKFGDPGTAGQRIKPYLIDAQSALDYPADAIKWNKPNDVIDHLEDAMRSGFAAPRGLLSDMYNISGTEKMWQDQFIPMLKDKGYDSMWYPHYDDAFGGDRYNTFMAFDPGQLTPRYSPEGQALIKERGVKEQAKALHWDWDAGTDLGGFKRVYDWKLPKGILKPEKEVESFIKELGSKETGRYNTYKWWENPNSPLQKIENAEIAKRPIKRNKWKNC